MFYRILILFFCSFSALFAAYPATEDQKGALEEILDLFGLKASETRECWVQMGKERWEYDRRYEEMRPVLWPLFERAGLINEAFPSESYYDYLLIHGALLSRIEKRWCYACELWKKGIRFGEIVFLSGERAILESERKRATGASTEFDLMKWVYAQTALPEDMERIPTSFINAQAAPGMTRPTTRDTILAWLAEKPAAGKCLAISNQPYVHYQDAVVLSFLPSSFSLETVGPGVDDPPKISIFLDTLGKILLYSVPPSDK